MFQYPENQDAHRIPGITDIHKAGYRDEYVVLVERKSLEDEEGTWEPVFRIFADVPITI